MYLVIGAAESSVKVTPMLLTVPFASTEEGWIYDVQAYPKAEKSNTAGITVEKRLYRINPNTFELDEITADDATYKVGLFLDKDGTIPYGDDYIRTIHIQNAQSGKASYSNVLRGTYYVFELDENNTAIKLNDEVNQLAGEPQATSGGMVFLFSLITCGIYGIYWAYKMGERCDRIRGIQGNSSILYLVLSILGLDIVYFCLLQDMINKEVS